MLRHASCPFDACCFFLFFSFLCVSVRVRTVCTVRAGSFDWSFWWYIHPSHHYISAPPSPPRRILLTTLLFLFLLLSHLATCMASCPRIDTSNQPDKRVGNERKLQKTWQSMPLRPQSLFIVGAGLVKRVFLTALIKFASVFSNSKVLERIRFVEMDAVRKEVPKDNMPEHLGGKKHEATAKMVYRRLGAIQKVATDVMQEKEATLPPLRKAPPKVVAL